MRCARADARIGASVAPAAVAVAAATAALTAAPASACAATRWPRPRPAVGRDLLGRQRALAAGCRPRAGASPRRRPAAGISATTWPPKITIARSQASWISFSSEV